LIGNIVIEMHLNTFHMGKFNSLFYITVSPTHCGSYRAIVSEAHRQEHVCLSLQ